MGKIKDILEQENVSKAFCSKAFVWCWLTIVFVCWATGGWIAGFIMAAVVACVILCLCKDTMPVIAILWTFLFMLGKNRHDLQGMAWLISFVALIPIGAIVNIVRFRPSFKFFNYRTITVTTLATIVFCVANMISGIARAERYQNFADHGVVATIAGLLCVVLALGYVFFNATASGGEDGKRIIDYVLHLMFATSVLIMLQLIVYYARIGGGFDAILDGFKHKSVDLGWGGPNNYSIILATMMPATLYYAVKYGKFSPLYLLYALVQYFFVFMSSSRGAILFGAIGLIAGVGLCVYKCKYRGRAIITVCLTIVVGIFLFMAYADKIHDVMDGIMSRALDGSGRDVLYEDAIKSFKNNPIFGTGFDYRMGAHVGRPSDGYTPYWYHSTFFQALGATGIVGFIAWLFLEWSRVRAFLTRRSTEKWFMLFGFAIFFAYGLIDVFYYTPNGLIFLFIFTLAAEKSVEPEKLRPALFELIDAKAFEKRVGEYKRENVENDTEDAE